MHASWRWQQLEVFLASGDDNACCVQAFHWFSTANHSVSVCDRCRQGEPTDLGYSLLSCQLVISMANQ
jgi:hypothetical protein